MLIKKVVDPVYCERVNLRAIPPLVLEVRYWFETYGVLMTLSK